MTANQKSRVLFLSLLLFAFSLSACTDVEQRWPRPSEDWSRSIPLGEKAAGSIGLSVEGGGSRVHAVWLSEAAEREQIRYVQLDGEGSPVVAKTYDFHGRLKFARILGAAPGVQHLFWANRAPGASGWGLHHGLLDAEGGLVISPDPVSPPGANVGKYVVAADHAGGAVVVWDRSDPGDLVLVHLDSRGRLLAGPLVLDVEGEAPSLAVDREGMAHLSWMADRSIFYTRLDLADPAPAPGTRVVDLNASGLLGTTGDSLAGPVLGYADGWVYLFWSVLSNSDLENGTASTEYVAFPANQPVLTAAEQLYLLTVEEPPTWDYAGDFSLSRLGPVVEFSKAVNDYGQVYIRQAEILKDWYDIQGAVSNYLMNPATGPGGRQELAVVLGASQDYRYEDQMQIAVAVFAAGRFQGYSVATKTGRVSDHPALAVDGNGDLHVAWREGAWGREIYYATTAPAAMAALDRVTSDDLLGFVYQAGIDGLVGAALTPMIGLLWVLPGLIMVVAWQILRRRIEADRKMAVVPLALAISSYYLVKFLTLPTALPYVPFSAWISIPAEIGLVLRLGIPCLLFLVGLLVAAGVRRRFSVSAVLFYLAFVLPESFLTMMIYGVNFLGIY